MNLLKPIQWLANKSVKLAKVSWPAFLAVIPLTFFVAPDALGVTISDIANNTGTSMTYVAGLLEDVSLIAGIGFVMASFFKFHQHKLNPQQVPISQGITLLLVGGGLTIFPALLPVGGKALAGSGASFGSLTDQTGGNIISNLNGSTGGGKKPPKKG
jgi:intracellular multiplication protein IcmD